MRGWRTSSPIGPRSRHEVQGPFLRSCGAVCAIQAALPEALFQYLASVAPARDTAWDCATGNGQAAAALAAQFQRVIATDASVQQIESADPQERVEYGVAPAEFSGLPAESVDLITVAQALHWFNIAAFFVEARRVLKRGGILSVWSYNLLSVSPEIDAFIGTFYHETTAPFWPPERRILEDGYVTIEFPFEELATPSFEMQESWTLDQLLGYLRTWSATQKFVAARGYDPVTSVGVDLGKVWGAAHERRIVRWPLSLRAGRCAARS